MTISFHKPQNFGQILIFTKMLVVATISAYIHGVTVFTGPYRNQQETLKQINKYIGKGCFSCQLIVRY